MIWLDAYGGMSPPGTLVGHVTIDGMEFRVSYADNFGIGQRYIVFNNESPFVGSGTLNLVSFFSYLRQEGLVTGEEYFSAIELGNEIDGPSVGETRVNRYIVTVE
jgi:hypothetical protein